MRRQDCEVTCPQEKERTESRERLIPHPGLRSRTSSHAPRDLTPWFIGSLKPYTKLQTHNHIRACTIVQTTVVFLSQTDNNQGRTYDFEALVRNTKRGHILRKYQQPKFGVLQYIQHIFYSNYNTHVFFNSTNYNWYKC